MTSKVSICNAALSMIGADSIISFDDSTPNARHCRNVYDQTRRALLRSHPWSCAKKRVQLTPLAAKPAFGPDNAFALPGDFVRVLECNAYSYSIEGRQILCREGALQLVYIYDNTDESTWDDMLVEAMSLSIAAKLAKPLTGSTTEADSKANELQMFLKRARAVNGQEFPSQTLDPHYESELLRVRHGG